MSCLIQGSCTMKLNSSSELMVSLQIDFSLQSAMNHSDHFTLS